MSEVDDLDALDDVVVIKRPGDARSVAGMLGECALSDWRDTQGALRKFSCRIRNMTPQIITIELPVTGSVGQWVVASFGQLGSFEGPILKVLKRAFIMRIVATNDDRVKIAATVEWAGSGKPEGRRFPRKVPANPNSILALSSGEHWPCLVIDYSVSGVAVSVEVAPAIGAIVRVGKVLGRVVRHFTGGFSVSFLTPQDSNLVEGLLSETG